MKLYSGKIPTIAAEVIQALVEANDIEVSDPNEAQLDIEAILKEYLRLDRELTDQAKDLMEARKLSYGQFGKLKRSLADERGFVLGEEATTYIANQVLESFMASAHVDEVFSDDVVLRKKVKDV